MLHSELLSSLLGSNSAPLPIHLPPAALEGSTTASPERRDNEALVSPSEETCCESHKQRNRQTRMRQRTLKGQFLHPESATLMCFTLVSPSHRFHFYFFQTTVKMEEKDVFAFLVFNKI